MGDKMVCIKKSLHKTLNLFKQKSKTKFLILFDTVNKKLKN